jgi:hypothetical protein
MAIDSQSIFNALSNIGGGDQIQPQGQAQGFDYMQLLPYLQGLIGGMGKGGTAVGEGLIGATLDQAQTQQQRDLYKSLLGGDKGSKLTIDGEGNVNVKATNLTPLSSYLSQSLSGGSRRLASGSPATSPQTNGGTQQAANFSSETGVQNQSLGSRLAGLSDASISTLTPEMFNKILSMSMGYEQIKNAEAMDAWKRSIGERKFAAENVPVETIPTELSTGQTVGLTPEQAASYDKTRAETLRKIEESKAKGLDKTKIAIPIGGKEVEIEVSNDKALDFALKMLQLSESGIPREAKIVNYIKNNPSDEKAIMDIVKSGGTNINVGEKTIETGKAKFELNAMDPNLRNDIIERLSKAQGVKWEHSPEGYAEEFRELKNKYPKVDDAKLKKLAKKAAKDFAIFREMDNLIMSTYPNAEYDKDSKSWKVGDRTIQTWRN